jgi:hypothetical protein
MKIIQYFVQLVLLLGLALTLSTCTREEVCPPEEEDAAIQFRALVRSFGDRYKVTGYTINGVDRSSYLDTMHLRNKVIDFRDFDFVNQRVKRNRTDPAGNCYRVVSYLGRRNIDTIEVVGQNNYLVLETSSKTDVGYAKPYLLIGWQLRSIIFGQSQFTRNIIPISNTQRVYYYYAAVSTADAEVKLITTIENQPYILTLTPR